MRVCPRGLPAWLSGGKRNEPTCAGVITPLVVESIQEAGLTTGPASRVTCNMV